MNDSEWVDLSYNANAIEAIRGTLKEDTTTPSIPLTCSGHKTGLAVRIFVEDDYTTADWVGPARMMMSIHHDRKPDSPRIPSTEIAGAWTSRDKDRWKLTSYTIPCGTCGRSIRRKKVKILRDTIVHVVKFGTVPHSISLT